MIFFYVARVFVLHPKRSLGSTPPVWVPSRTAFGVRQLVRQEACPAWDQVQPDSGRDDSFRWVGFRLIVLGRHETREKKKVSWPSPPRLPRVIHVKIMDVFDIFDENRRFALKDKFPVISKMPFKNLDAAIGGLQAIEEHRVHLSKEVGTLVIKRLGHPEFAYGPRP